MTTFSPARGRRDRDDEREAMRLREREVGQDELSRGDVLALVGVLARVRQALEHAVRTTPVVVHVAPTLSGNT